tara:strand:- start:5013 stop:5237 length:225 start_codon:yes stop_codon:yes gene_type:complete
MLKTTVPKYDIQEEMDILTTPFVMPVKGGFQSGYSNMLKITVPKYDIQEEMDILTTPFVMPAKGGFQSGYSNMN